MTENGPLAGRTVVITRAIDQAAELAALLDAYGAEVLPYPTIRIAEPDSWERVDRAIDDLKSYEWAVFTSANAVDRFMDRMLDHHLDARSFCGLMIAAVGPATAERLYERGIVPDCIPEEAYRAEGLIELLAEYDVGEGTRVLIPCAKKAREALPEALRERGASVDAVTVYRTVTGEGDARVADRLRSGDVDVITFTSGSTARNFVALMGPDAARVLERCTVATIGPITSDAVRDLGFCVDVEASDSTVRGLVDALAAHVAGGD